jgi:hypothetical protein
MRSTYMLHTSFAALRFEVNYGRARIGHSNVWGRGQERPLGGRSEGPMA